jgi:hypothetical protein
MIRVCVYVFINVNNYMCMSICVCIIFLIKKYHSSITINHTIHLCTSSVKAYKIGHTLQRCHL